MKRPDSQHGAMERLAGELLRTGESLSDLMRRVTRRLAGGKDVSSEMNNQQDVAETFDEALADALREEMGCTWPAPASRPGREPSTMSDEEWDDFDRELERDLKRKFNL